MKNSLLFTSTAVAALTLAIAAQAQAPKLTTEKFADGSGQIGVATGWKVTSAGQGAVSLSGPGKAGVLLGVALFVFAHNHDQNSPIPGVNPEVPRVRLDDPVLATLGVIEAGRKTQGMSKVKLKAVEPATGFPGNAAFIRYSVQVKGKPTEVFGLYSIMPTDHDSGTYYFSAVYASPGEFNKRLPEMMAMWKSWNLSPKLIQDRLNSAQKTLGEIDMPGKLDAINQERRDSAERMAKKFQGYIRQ